MVAIRQEVPLIRVSDQTRVSGWLITLTEQHVDDFETFWQERLRESADEDQYWDWAQKKRIYLQRDGTGLYEGYAIEYEQRVQGLMLLQTGGHRSWIEPSRRLVYVHSLATAPWNRIDCPEPTGFRSVGRALLKFAQFRSEALGYGGLVGLHSLRGAESFYRKMEMIDGGLDPQKDNLRYFEWYRPRPDWFEEYGVEEYGVDLESDA
jgi:hypothetical protein